ncbi:DUF4157 domain-containing protein [Streptomyces sp. NPDC087440]|uniref:eCIS core domain-containing protein n=1 Tax=Streptomyces sp. NPDC087440 TaxID=3365790 RepID=UPI00382F0948
MRTLQPGHGRAQDREAGKPAVRPVASPMSGAWLQHIQRAAQPSASSSVAEPDHAQVQRAALNLGISSPAEGLETGLRTELEQRFGGADFSGALIHRGSQARESAALLDAKAYTSGPHIVVGGDMSMKDWAHEFAHFQDQQQGPVPGRDNGQGVSVSTPGDSGERHAEQKADEVMRGPSPVQRTVSGRESGQDRGPAAHPGGGGCAGGDGCGGPGPSVQRMHVIKAGSAEYPAKNPDSDDFFVGQEPNDRDSWFDEQSSHAPPKPHLVYKGEVDLAVSDGFDLAVEHAGAGQEPKNFFATDKQFSDSVKKLPGAHQNKGMSLSKTGRTLTIEGRGKKVTLYEIEPKLRKEKGGPKTKGLEVTGPQRCNEMIGVVTGKRSMARGADAQYWEVLEKFLVRLDPQGGWKGRYQEAMDLGSDGDTEPYMRTTEAMSGRFQELVKEDEEKAEAALKALGINQHAPTPKVGEGMTTMTQPNAEQAGGMRGATPFHFGGVIARSGDDYITMENYFREQKEGTLPTSSANDPLWYFRMYGQEAGRTWHEGWTGAGLFVGATITMTLRG